MATPVRLLRLLALHAVAWIFMIPVAPGADSGYPARHIRMIAPFSAGSTLDITARLVADQLGARLGHNVVVDNRAGANGVIGTDLVAKSAPDGHTLLFTTGSFTGNLLLVKNLPYDGTRDFSPVTQVARSYGLVLVVHPAVKAGSLKELIALAKGHPGALKYGSGGVGNMTHLAGELFGALAAVQLTHVPYKGSGPAMADVVGQQIEMSIVSTVFVQPFIKAGRVRALALTGPERAPVLPDVPTFKELGFPEFEWTGWYGLWFPARTPQARVNRIQSEIRNALAAPDVKSRLDELGIVPVASTPAEFARFLKDDLALQARIVKMAGLQPQ